MYSVFVFLVLVSSGYGLLSVKTSVEKETANVCFKFRPKYYDLKDYVGILKFTMRLLDRNNKLSVYKNMREMKHEIHKALTKPKRDCKSLYDSGIRVNGVYNLSPEGSASFRAYCDMANGGWTVIQRRWYGDVKFNRKWNAYAEGFPKLELKGYDNNRVGDHWLGLRHIHELTKNNPSQISFQFLMAANHTNATAIYNGFYIDDEEAEFRMHVKPNAKYNKFIRDFIQDNGFYYHNNMKFSTVDNDNDEHKGNCATTSGYWYRACVTLALVNGDFNAMSIWNRKHFKIIRSEIKIRRTK